MNIFNRIISKLYNSKILFIHKIGLLIFLLNQQKRFGLKKLNQKKAKIKITKNNNNPPLSWICKIKKNEYQFTIGKYVEKTQKFVFEGSWDGNFTKSTPENSQCVFGSGAIINKNIIFIPPKHIFECLYVIVDKKRKLSYVSNSVVYIVKNAIKNIDKNIFIKMLSNTLHDSINVQSVEGIDKYNPKIFEDKNYIFYRMLFYNFSIDYLGNLRIKINLPKNNFKNFIEYKKYLLNKIRKIFNNANSKHRTNKFTPISTISRGYDSPTVAILAKKCHCTEALTLNTKVYGNNDSGEKIGKFLGLKIYVFNHILNFKYPKNIDNLNIQINNKLKKVAHEFIATGGVGDDIAYYPFKNKLKNKILLTGTFGDSMWDINTKVKPGISCTIPYMKSITEFRLNNNFIFFPVPVLSARFPQQVINISKSIELQKYSNNTNYDRPICRKIIESEKISNKWFGIGKNATAPNIINHKDLFYNSFTQTMKRYT